MLCRELLTLRDEADAAAAELQAIAASLRDQQLVWRSAPNKWSIADILVHLRITTEHCLPAVDHALQDAHRRGLRANRPFKLTIMGRFFVWYVEPPPPIKLPAPKKLVPILTCPPKDALPAFLRSQEAMMLRVERANGLDLNRVRFWSPFAGFISMDMLAFFSVFASHERRHIWQARNVLKAMAAEKV